MTGDKTIRITCEGAGFLPLAEFEHFQGELKSLDQVQYEKLKASILEDGFHDPIHVWRKKGEKRPRKMLDGHQRVRTVRHMIEKEGYELDGDGALPVVWVEADSEQQANRIVLEKMSQYGRYDEDSIYEFIGERALDWTAIRPLVDFPAIHMGKFQVGWFGDPEVKEPKKPEEKESPIRAQESPSMTRCPKCGHEFEA